MPSLSENIGHCGGLRHVPAHLAHAETPAHGLPIIRPINPELVDQTYADATGQDLIDVMGFRAELPRPRLRFHLAYQHRPTVPPPRDRLSAEAMCWTPVLIAAAALLLVWLDVPWHLGQLVGYLTH